MHFYLRSEWQCLESFFSKNVISQSGVTGTKYHLIMLRFTKRILLILNIFRIKKKKIPYQVPLHIHLFLRILCRVLLSKMQDNVLNL